MKRLRLSAVLAFVVSTAFAANYYVSPTGNDANDGLSTSTPKRSIQAAANLTNPGDTVYLMSGLFEPQTDYERTDTLVSITRSGTASAWIRYTAYPGATPVVKGTGWNTFKIHGGASYIEISFLEIVGDNANLTLAGALAQPTSSPYDTRYNTNGITIDGRNDGTAKPHHIRIIGNVIRDLPAGGIATMQCDYLTIDSNIVYNTSWYTIWATSGISIWQAWNFDANTGYRMYITNNECYGNKTQVPWVVTGKLSDGNGIIWDDSKNTQNRSRLGLYNGRVLIANNLCYNNGGSGIHSYLSEHADIINNSTYNNGQVVGYPEIFTSASNDCRVLNNIVYGRAGAIVASNTESTNTTFDYNVYYNGEPWVTGANDVEGDPKYANPAARDFHLQSGSIAVNRGLNQAGLTPTTDIDGATRPQGGAVDIGAYETNYTGTAAATLSSVVLEAENATIRSGPGVSTSGGRYYGTGFTQWGKNSNGHYLEFHFNRPVAATRTLKVRYTNANSTACVYSVSINGVVVNSSFSLPPSGSDQNAFVNVSLPNVSLPAGNVQLRLTKVSGGSMRLDTLALFQ